HEEYEAAIARYPKAKDVIWAQEEPENQGAWYQVKHRLRGYLAIDHRLLYATRPGTSTTAVGYLRVHKQEQEDVVKAALTGGIELERGT
ncbi:MAG: hypothetical protein L0H29_09485, partial [Sinobacteraceae bacterium]|nr:hypothetical protein [Nevskiaceae bacterium]